MYSSTESKNKDFLFFLSASDTNALFQLVRSSCNLGTDCCLSNRLCTLKVNLSPVSVLLHFLFCFVFILFFTISADDCISELFVLISVLFYPLLKRLCGCSYEFTFKSNSCQNLILCNLISLFTVLPNLILLNPSL